MQPMMSKQYTRDDPQRFDVFMSRQALINKRRTSNWYLLDLVTLAALVGTIAAIIAHEVLR